MILLFGRCFKMDIVVKESEGCYQLEEFDTGAIIYLENDFPEVLIPLESGLYQLKSVNEATGKVSIIENEIMVKTNIHCILRKQRQNILV